MGFLEKEQKLPPAVKSLFSSEKPYVEVQKACFMYGVDPDKGSPIADVVGLIFVGDVTLSDLPKKIAEEMSLAQDVTYGIAHHIGKSLFQPLGEHFKDAEKLVSEWQQLKSAGLMSEDQTIQKVLERDSWIFEIGKTEPEEREEKMSSVATVSLPILQALSKYENLGNQLITQERIKIKTQGESVRPSLFYWLRYYRDELGIGQHNSVERGDFLFRSENGKRLSPEERERVNLILKSIEENLPLTVDTKQQEIIFPAFQGVLVSPRESGSGRLSQTTEQNVAGREIRNGIGNMPIVAIPSVPLASNERQTFFHSIDQAETPRVTIQTDILSETGSVPLARHDLHNNSGEPARHDLHNNSGGMSFSSSHTFPVEKDVKEQKPQSAPHLFNPFSIRPVSRREEDDK
ncbi:MAG: hypothetical protein AUK19_01555 [Candidatus Moranbacteria bacterium CG2_30_45_14]|nr:MAG: hypothetical protein AUK19_01555 [Candidatus Moranbacteria bacterium CG2_30_45_14]